MGNKFIVYLLLHFLGNFCNGRPEGNYRNPWDCHSYYVCRALHRVHKQVCNLIVQLNYDPVLDTCTYPAQMKCKQLSEYCLCLSFPTEQHVLWLKLARLNLNVQSLGQKEFTNFFNTFDNVMHRQNFNLNF